MFIRTLITVALLLSATAPVRAQDAVSPWLEPSGPLVRDALEIDYAQALLKRFAASVRKHGDPSCLQAKALDDAALIARGRALWQRHGEQMMTIVNEGLDIAAYQSAMAESAGPGAAEELKRLERDDDVARYVALYRPARLAKVINIIAENFERYALVKRFRLDGISPEGTGELEFMKDNPTEAMRANPTQAAEEAAQQFADLHPSPRMERYLDLLDASEAAIPKSINKQSASKIGPMEIFAGADRELADLCVGRR